MSLINEKKVKEPLAINGGNPVRTKSLPWEFPGAHYIDDDELSLVTSVIKAKSPFRYYGIDLQDRVDQLEDAFRKKFQVSYALGVNSGTSALHIAFAAMGIGPGDEVLIPGYMWVSCISGLIRLGAIPRLVDIDNTFCMDPNDLKNQITPHSKAILFVHMSGATGHIEEVAKIAKENKLFLLEDCAQSLGTNIKNKFVGTFGDIGIFSFQLNKNITSGEGGMIICRDEHLYKRCFAIHDLGFSRNEAGRLDPSDKNYQLWGTGSRMSELTGAMALAQFNKFEMITKHMRDAKWTIRHALEPLNKIEFRYVIDPAGDSSCFLLMLFPTAEIAEKFISALVAEGIKGPPGSMACVTMKNWGLHWYFNIPSLINKTSWCEDGFPWTHSKNNFAKDYQYEKGCLSRCDDYASRGGLLTIASNLTQEDIRDVITAFHKVYFHLMS